MQFPAASHPDRSSHPLVFLQINLFCDIFGEVWLCGITWLLTVIIPFPSELLHLLIEISPLLILPFASCSFPFRDLTPPLGKFFLQRCNICGNYSHRWRVYFPSAKCYTRVKVVCQARDFHNSHFKWCIF